MVANPVSLLMQQSLAGSAQPEKFNLSLQTF
jgi:hypothetical protein